MAQVLITLIPHINESELVYVEKSSDRILCTSPHGGDPEHIKGIIYTVRPEETMRHMYRTLNLGQS